MVVSVNVMRPTTVVGLVLSTGTIGTAGTDYFVKVKSATLSHYTQIKDITGDSDQAPRMLPNFYVYADWMIRGYAVAGQAIGILSMKDVLKNPTGITLVTFNLDSGRTLTGNFFIHQVKIEWDRVSPYVGLSMAMKNTNVDTTGEIAFTET